ncbi:MAG: galactose mutarotase, partial [Verrucomicrobia bacterium]
ELRIRYLSRTDKPTPLSLTNHTYFNLNGFKDRILDHVVQLLSDRYLVPDETNVPVGEEAAVAGTACDFNQHKRLGEAFKELPLGFEHYYVFRKPDGELAKVAEITEPTSGRKLEVLTTEPGGLFYTGRYTSDELRREDGTQFGKFRGFCLETSKYPNGPNIAGSPRSILLPGETREDVTVFKLSW